MPQPVRLRLVGGEDRDGSCRRVLRAERGVEQHVRRAGEAELHDVRVPLRMRMGLLDAAAGDD